MGDEVLYEAGTSVAWLTINRPEARNALSAAARDGLATGLRRFTEDDGAKVLVITGAGDQAFCAGADLKEMASAGLKVPPPEFLPQVGAVAKPVIAAVNGVAYAGGFLLAQSCDLCIAADTARFAISEVKVGRGAPWAAPLPWLIPPRIAMQLLLTGDPITAQRAPEIGLVNEVVPAGPPPAAAPVRGELTAPDGSAWEGGPADAAGRVEGSALDFCLLVTQRRHRADTALRATGPVA